MNTSQIKNFAIQSRNILKAGVLNRILTLGYDKEGALTVDRPVKIQGATVFMGQLREESFYDAWVALEERIAKHGVKGVCEEAAYTWFNRLVAIRIMQKNEFIEPVMQYVSQETRIPIIVDQARSGRLSLKMSAQVEAKLNELLRDSTKTNEQFNLLISAYCLANPVIFNCFGGIEKHISLLLPDNILSQGGFIDLLNNTPYLTDEDYTKSELIGWLYQFYISEKKDEVFAKKGKYTPDEIPSATQIFTPNWIVKYMVENTIGRIYLDNNPYADEIKDSMKYLVEPAEPTPKDAILKLDDLTEYKMIDNACGSGHILIEGFNLFYRMYKYEGYATRAAIQNILQKNIIGLDLDTRAKQLATFALLMTAARIDKSFLDCKVMPRVLDFPEPFVYRGGTMEDFLPHYFLGGNQKIIKETIKAFELLKDADSLGSIMKFEISAETREAIRKSTEDWEKQEFLNPTIAGAIPSMKIILALTDKYSIAAMNPPYMGGGRFEPFLSQYIERHYRSGKADLFSTFMLVGMECLHSNGKMGMINMQSWMFLSSFKDLRVHFIDNYHFDSLLHLGPRTFDELSGEVVQNVAFIASKHTGTKSDFYRLVEGRNCSEKEILFRRSLNAVTLEAYKSIDTSLFESIPGQLFGYWLTANLISKFNEGQLGQVLTTREGMATADNDRFLRSWAEISTNKFSKLSPDSDKWYPYNKGGGNRKWYGLREYVVNWAEDGKEIRNNKDPETGRIRSHNYNGEYAFNECLTWSAISSEGIAVRYCEEGFLWDSKGACGFSHNHLKYCLGFINSKVASKYLSVLSPTLDIKVGDVIQLPYIENDPVSIVSLTDQCIGVSKEDWDAHETSWDFKKNELILLKERGLGTLQAGWGDEISLTMTSLSLLIAEYKAKWLTQFEKLHSNEEELNRQFIEIYGLQEELTPEVPKDEITILQQGEISIKDDQIVWHDDVIVKQFISYAIGCWMGRYRLDKEGLNIAHYPADEEVCTYEYNGFSFEIDDDAIIPLMGPNNPFEDDNALQKLINFVKIVFGEESMTENLNHIEHCLGKSLENYLIKDFWKDHKKMYQNRPIYWLFSSKKGAFQVLTYMHRMNPYTVEKIRTKYLLPYIDYLKGRIEVDEARGSELSSVERANLAKMRVALEECNEYHDRLHEIALEAIDFDLDDGVVVNYAKFGDVVAKIK
ncbi:MAG: BREX-1 system adenine-specific DNA-methyltransferase PglX [Bacteroidales bacterium]|nr:BREX-1 system adenine-specific DNA-methyltransferase PglX [Bacteroidales bacterium]